MTIGDPVELVGDVEDGKTTPAVTEKSAVSASNSFDGVDKALGPGLSKGHDLTWSNVNLKVLEKKGSDDVKLHILKNVWGRAEAGKTTAIMGASGAGSK